VINLQTRAETKFGAVVIGRNEGERLKRCLNSLTSVAALTVYVDSGSTDGSREWAHGNGTIVVGLDTSRPFTAARARNAGFERLRKLAPDLRYVQFVDGDCELIDGWCRQALAFLESNPNFAAVAGRRRERYPERSIYNWLSDQEWVVPAGEVRAFGGDVMMRVTAFETTGGYRDKLIAGEDPELSVRIRAAGWRIWYLDLEMTLHDVNMTRFSQWFQRALRTGYAFAQGAYLHGAPPERHRVWECRRAWLWGLVLPITFLLAGWFFRPWGWLIWLIYPLQVLRQIARNDGPLGDRTIRSLFQLLSRFPESLGQLKFVRDRLLGRQSSLIEYK
jgi:GT2 family glycosyltransferase